MIIELEKKPFIHFNLGSNFMFMFHQSKYMGQITTF